MVGAAHSVVLRQGGLSYSATWVPLTAHRLGVTEQMLPRPGAPAPPVYLEPSWVMVPQSPCGDRGPGVPNANPSVPVGLRTRISAQPCVSRGT